MGIIKDGSVSGKLPTNEVFAVHYPAYPSSVERAVETLGGIQGIVKARTSESNKLELHFRPEDPYSHPAFGELKHSNNFLLKISKCKVRAVQSADSSCGILIQSSRSPVNCEQENSLAAPKVNESRCLSAGASKEIEMLTLTNLQEHLAANIVSHVSEGYHFNGMVDYQHVLAVHADDARRKKRQWAEVEPKFGQPFSHYFCNLKMWKFSVLIPNFLSLLLVEKGGLMDVDQEDLMILLPSLFASKDMPDNIVCFTDFVWLVIGGCTWSVISAYAPQVGLDEEAKKLFYEDLDEVVRGIPNTEKIVIGGDFNGHIGATSNGFDDVHGGFGFGERNGGGTSLLDFAKAFELVIANSCFPKKENHLVTFRSSVAKTHIDYFLLRKGDRGLFKDCKIISSENLTTQHKLLVMDLEIKRARKKKIVSDRPRIK
ncbi:hypothetical protein H5410_059051 [Solanum commersonii]|uniref:Transcription factor IIIC subunit Tfc1/Sfc1 triple barrel domain-containing protein n=1 Tax=Solanum commersonii TaxID=4109 RepID=A0A9J5W1B6_SOLCO|nr:hypothetical protein H5410_059051 [Solanum commersonii]